MKIKAEKRIQRGTGGARKVRAVGKVPAVIYGRGEESLLLQIDTKTAKSLSRGEHLTLELGKPLDVIVKEIQLEPTTSKVTHIDFQHLHRGEKVKVRIPVVLDGADVVAKKGGVLEQMMSEVEIECLPEDIPGEIKIDASSLEIGESIHLKDLSQLVGMKGRFIMSLDSTVAIVVAPKAVEEKKPLPAEVVEGEKVEEAKAEGEKEKEEKAEEKKEKDEKSRDKKSKGL